ncbi:MAG TPA: HAD-IB family hydrolase [Candidatus Acidoferrum sp.]|nr:HAD-IB family hydrolase [Candidatus Acidoferrum sp.]
MEFVTTKIGERGRVAAFFDLDGTVVVPPSLEFRFAVYLARHGELRAAAAFAWLGVFLKEGMKNFLGHGGASARFKAVDENKLYLRGLRVVAAVEWMEKNAATIEFYPEALRRIAWHREHGHAIFLVSGTLAVLARSVGAQLGRAGEIGVAATELESLAGQWIGCVAGAAVSGPGKARAIREISARNNNLDLARSFAYGDSLADRWMLALVGNATVVNPGARLTWLARRRGWRIARWQRDEPDLEFARDTAGQASMTWEKS